MRTFKALVKREYWEHRGAMYSTPIVMSGFFAALMIVMLITINFITTESDGISFSVFSLVIDLVVEMNALGAVELEKAVQAMLYTPVIIFTMVMLVICFFYSLGCLYDERRDRSILFWKSLPVSDTQTVLSKYTSIAIVTPVIYASVIVIFQLYILVFGTVFSWFSGESGLLLWTSANLFSIAFNTLTSVFVWCIWFSPIWAWLMFASAWAKKVAFLWGVLPIFLIVIAEATLFRSYGFIEMVGVYCLKGLTTGLANLANAEGVEIGFIEASNSLEAFTYLDFWLGLMVTALFLGGAIYIRRFRDES